MRKFYFFLVISFLYINSSYPQYNFSKTGYNAINFEGAGFVSAVIPSYDGKTIFARTDIGGIYKQDYDSEVWEFMSQFAPSPAALMVQSLMQNPHNHKEIIVATGMDYLFDDKGRGLWKTNDGGKNWYQVLGPLTGNEEINYGGNIFKIKIGGPCILYHPIEKDVVFAGSLYSGLYISYKNGEPKTWEQITPKGLNIGSVVTLAMHKTKPNVLWVGTNRGLWLCYDYGSRWEGPLFPEQIQYTYQMLLKAQKDNSITAFVSCGKLIRIDNDGKTSKDLSGLFGGNPANGNDIISLTFLDKNEDKILASRIGGPTRIGTGNGEKWKEPLDLIIEKSYNPRHSLHTEDKIYYAKVVFMQNPVYPENWYVSGGSGCFKSTNRGFTWKYNVEGINMPVVYNVNFSDNGNIYMPISDWGMAKTNDIMLPEITNYSRQSTLFPPPPEKNGDTYIPNITRVLVSKVKNSRIYCIGGSVYTHYAAMCKSEYFGNPASYTILQPKGLPVYPAYDGKYDVVITNGSITSTDGTTDKIVLLVGSSTQKRKIFDPNQPDKNLYGVYFSDDNAASFYKSEFKGESYNKLAFSLVGNLFTTEDNIEVDPVVPSRIYLYLEGGNEMYQGNTIQAGGFFVSENSGRNFEWKSFVVENPAKNYRDKGKMQPHNVISGLVYLGIANQGLFKTTDAGETWKKIKNIESVTSVDVRDEIVVFHGKMSGDIFDRLYMSFNGGNTWEPIEVPGIGPVPSTRALNIRPNRNEIWISTGGQGVVIYRF